MAKIKEKYINNEEIWGQGENTRGRGWERTELTNRPKKIKSNMFALDVYLGICD